MAEAKSNPALEDLIPEEGEERARLERVHALLLEAGPPAELSLRLLQPNLAAWLGDEPATTRERRRWLPRLALASALAAAVVLGFASGLVLHHGGERYAARLSMTAPPAAPASVSASLAVAAPDRAGNREIELVARLPRLNAGRYELLLLRRQGRPLLCGAFQGRGAKETVRMTIPYDLETARGWSLVAVQGGRERTVLVSGTLRL